jgi:hypothetical protein
MLLLASLFSILATGYIGYISGTEALTQGRFNELKNLRSAKDYQVQFYFQLIQNQAWRSRNQWKLDCAPPLILKFITLIKSQVEPISKSISKPIIRSVQQNQS